MIKPVSYDLDYYIDDIVRHGDLFEAMKRMSEMCENAYLNSLAVTREFRNTMIYINDILNDKTAKNDLRVRLIREATEEFLEWSGSKEKLKAGRKRQRHIGREIKKVIYDECKEGEKL